MKPTSILVSANDITYSTKEQVVVSENLDELQMLFNLIVIDGYIFFLMIVLFVFWIKIERNRTEETTYWTPKKARDFNEKDFKIWKK